MLVVGAVIVFSAAAGHRSDAWYVATGFEKHRLLDHGVWSLAAMTIGLAVLPVVATVAAFSSRHVRATAEGRAFVIVGVSAIVAFVTYAAVKGAYLSTVFALLIVERNVIYLVPVVLTATAAVLARPIASAPGLTAGFLVALLLIVRAEFRLDQYPYFEAPSLAIGHFANRIFIWDAGDVERALVLVALVSVALLAARSFVRSRTTGLAIAVVAACGVAAWALTTEIYAARGLNTFSERMHQISPKPVDWVDQATGGEPTLFLGQQMGKDQNPIWLLEFWNYAIDKIWSLDGTAPLPSLSPDLGAARRHDEPRSGRQLGRDRERGRGRRREGRRAAQWHAALARHAAGPLPERADRRLPGRLDELESELLAVRVPRTASRAASRRSSSRAREPAPAASRRRMSLSGSVPSPWSTSSPASRASTRSSVASSALAALSRWSPVRKCRTTSR